MSETVFWVTWVVLWMIFGVIFGWFGAPRLLKRFRQRRTKRKIEYNKTYLPVTAGEVRALVRLDDEGRLPADGKVTPELLKHLLGCAHTNAPQPCAVCLGYTSEREMSAEIESSGGG